MSLVITGASGQLGRRTAELLLDLVDSDSVVLVTRTPQALDDLAARGAIVRRGDFDEPASLQQAFAGGQRLLLISTDAVGRRVAQHANAIEAARAAGVRHIAYTSIPNPSSENPAGVVPEHRATEDLLSASGLGWTFLRHSLYSEYQIPGVHARRAGASISQDDARAGRSTGIGATNTKSRPVAPHSPPPPRAPDLCQRQKRSVRNSVSIRAASVRQPPDRAQVRQAVAAAATRARQGVREHDSPASQRK